MGRCYQCGDEDIDEIRAKRKEQIREWAARTQAEADAHLTALVGVPGPGTFDGDLAVGVPVVENAEDVPEPEGHPEAEVGPVEPTPKPKASKAQRAKADDDGV